MSDHPRSNPPTWVEWKDCHKKWAWALSPEWASKWIVYRSHDWDVLKVLDLAGKFAIVVGVFFYFSEAGDRRKAKHYRAWELINSARGSTGDGGRRDALQELNGDKVSLIGAPLSNAFLADVQLQGANLARANLSEATLGGANLSEANLFSANLARARLNLANLTGAYLTGAYLTEAYLPMANLTGAYLAEANLSRADLSRANLTDVNLSRADLSGANLTDVNLSRADLSRANLTDVNLFRADLSGASVGRSKAPGELPDGFPEGWNASPPGWELLDDNGVARLRRSNALPAMPPSSPLPP